MKSMKARRLRGFLVMDATFALLAIVAMSAALLYTEGLQRRATQALNDRRTASRALEARLLALQAGIAPPRFPRAPF